MDKTTSLPADQLISCFGESTDCVKVIDTSGALLSFNDNGLKIMEIDDIRDVIGLQWVETWSGDMKVAAQDALDKALRGELGYFEGFCPTFKGTPKWWQVSVVPLMDNFKHVNWILAMSRDVTELHDLREEVAQLRTSVSSQPLVAIPTPQSAL